MNDEQIQNILNQYKQRQERDAKRYAVLKNDPDFIKLNRERAKQHYQKHKDKKLKYYHDNKEFMSAKCSYHYYRKSDRVDYFKEKYPEKVKVLTENNFLC